MCTAGMIRKYVTIYANVPNGPFSPPNWVPRSCGREMLPPLPPPAPVCNGVLPGLPWSVAVGVSHGCF